MGTPMYASAPTVDGLWYTMRIRPNGRIVGVVPGFFDSKVAADEHAKRFIGKT